MRRIFVCGFCCHVGRIVNYVTRVAAKSTDKKASEIGILINASSLMAKREAGHQLDRVQRGLDPMDWKPMNSIGQGVREIRIHHEGEYRVIYVASFKENVYVLHAFQKKTRKTSRQDLEAARGGFKEVLERQRS